jgi:hypothetical protein
MTDSCGYKPALPVRCRWYMGELRCPNCDYDGIYELPGSLPAVATVTGDGLLLGYKLVDVYTIDDFYIEDDTQITCPGCKKESQLRGYLAHARTKWTK